MSDFRELLESDHVTVFDGAMGTMLYAKGVYINRSYDELNLTQPDMVRGIHQEYLNAGAEIIETNTFGGNSFRLVRHGLADKVREINRTGADTVEIHTVERWLYDERDPSDKRVRCLVEDSDQTYTMKQQGQDWIIDSVVLVPVV